MSTTPPDYRALMTKALLEIKELKSQLQAARKRDGEAIAIVGAACRFPGGANDLAAYWDLLVKGRDGIVETPPERWSMDDYYDPDVDAPGKICSRLGGFLDQPVGHFDAAFFGISPREAQSMDPQQRLLLELCWEALEHANLVPEKLFQSNSGVFIGVSSQDHATRIIGDAPSTDIDGYYGTGCALAPIAGRISYIFGFTGPSFVVDTACSSSLLSLHLACESLRRRECDLALGGGIQLLTHPGISIAFTKAHMLSVDGRCKTFDAAANGYVRGEGGGMVVLKRLSDVGEGDTILALIRGSAVNQDGPSGGLTVPSGPSQEAVVRQALARGGVDPAHVNYIEAHGTGTPLGDPIEVGALQGVFGKHRTQQSPLWIGAVKTNIGHLEAGAGIASVIKLMLSLQHKTLVPHLHFKNPNPMIPWGQVPIRVSTSAAPWLPVAPEVPRTAGVSSFGFSGTNVHLVMSEAPATAAPPSVAPALPVQLIVLSARDEAALHALAERYIARLTNLDAREWPAMAHTAAVHRTHFSQRLAVAAATPEEARTRLLDRREAGAVWRGIAPEGQHPKVALLFSGQGSQYSGMGEPLYRSEPIFREVIDRCDQVLRPLLGQSLPDLLFAEGNALDQTGNTQPALYALEVALATLWQAWGGKIAAVLGHSVGEYAAAAIAGVFSIEDGARLIAERARLMQALPSGGGMVAVLTTRPEVEAAIQALGQHEISVAADNGPRNLVISGSAAALTRMQNHFAQAGVECRPLAVSHAFHSALMEPALAPFRSFAASIRYQAARLPIYSNVTGRREIGDRLANPDYWVDHIRKPVQFHEALRGLLADGCTLLVEAGPRPTLLGMGRAIAEASGSPLAADAGAWLPLLRHGQPAVQQVLSTLGGYWCRGGTPDWLRLADGHVELPTYPFQRRRCWRDVVLDAGSKGVAFEGTETLDHPLLARRFASKLLSERIYETPFSKSALPLLEDHRIFGELVVAGASHLSLIVGAALIEDPTLPLQLRQIAFPQALVIAEESERRVQLLLTPKPEAWAFRLVSFGNEPEPITHALGQIVRPTTQPTRFEWSALRSRCPENLVAEELYRAQARRQIVVGQSYRWLRKVWCGSSEAIAEVQPPDNVSGLGGYELHPGLIDSCFGLLVTTAGLTEEETIIPFSMESLTLYRRVTAEPMRAHAQLRSTRQDAQRLIGDIWLETVRGEPVACFMGLEGRKASRNALLALIDPSSRWLYQREWQPLALQSALPSGGTWLLCCDQAGCGHALAERWRATGRRVIEVCAGAALRALDAQRYEVDPTDHQQLRALFGQMPTPLAGVINLWPLNAAIIDWSDAESQQREILGTSVALLRGMALAGITAPLFLVSRQGYAVSAADTLPAPQMATLSGLLRSARVEYSQWPMAVIDLELQGAEAARSLGDGVALALRGETLVVCRQGQFFGERLQPYRPPAPTALAFGADQTYLITGGTGALGLAVAAWLVDQGVRSLLLLARRTPDPAAQTTLDGLRARGVHIEVPLVDVSDFGALTRVWEDAKANLPPIRGVIHLAGQLDDVLLAGMEWSRAYQPLSAKLAGAWNLHRLTEHQSVEMFLLFSSMTALLGSPAQGNYAAANAALDALAEHRRRLGLSGLSINWGPWAEIGMAARLDAHNRERLGTLGIDLLPPAHALRVLGTLLHQREVAEVAVMAIDWERYPNGAQPLTAHLQQPVATVESSGGLLRTLRELPSTRRRPELLRSLGRLLGEVLRMESGSRIDPRERLFDIGVDSLMAMELKNRLQQELAVTLSVTLLFDYPNLEALTNHLLDDLLPTVLQQETPSAEPSHDQNLDEMTDEDAEAALLAQLEALEKR